MRQPHEARSVRYGGVLGEEKFGHQELAGRLPEAARPEPEGDDACGDERDSGSYRNYSTYSLDLRSL